MILRKSHLKFSLLQKVNFSLKEKYKALISLVATSDGHVII